MYILIIKIYSKNFFFLLLLFYVLPKALIAFLSFVSFNYLPEDLFYYNIVTFPCNIVIDYRIANPPSLFLLVQPRKNWGAAWAPPYRPRRPSFRSFRSSASYAENSRFYIEWSFRWGPIYKSHFPPTHLTFRASLRFVDFAFLRSWCDPARVIRSQKGFYVTILNGKSYFARVYNRAELKNDRVTIFRHCRETFARPKTDFPIVPEGRRANSGIFVLFDGGVNLFAYTLIDITYREHVTWALSPVYTCACRAARTST